MTQITRSQAEAVVTALFRTPRASSEKAGPKPVSFVLVEQVEAAKARHPSSQPVPTG